VEQSKENSSVTPVSAWQETYFLNLSVLPQIVQMLFLLHLLIQAGDLASAA